MKTLESQQSSPFDGSTLSEYELERGKPMPSKNHARLQLKLASLLEMQYGKTFTMLSEISIKLANDKATPDIAIFPLLSFDWKHDEITLTEPPLTTIEILSPSQALSILTDKAEDYFSIGVKSCWIVLPQLTTILTMQASGRTTTYFQIGDTLTDPATGIVLDVGAVFGA